MKIYTKKQIQAIENEAKRKTIQSIQEGARQDVLTSSVLNLGGAGYVDKNNYKVYQKQIQVINEMYNNQTDYGSEILRPLIDTRVSFVGGAGISVISENKKVIKFIENLFKYNKFFGSRFLDSVKISEMEGKCLLILEPNDKDQSIRIRNLSYYTKNYEIITDKKDYEKILKIKFKNDDGEEESSIDGNFIYVKIGGSSDRVNDTPPKLSNCLTDIENMSRAKFDIRKNNHLFGKVMPYFKTQTMQEAKAINEAINNGDWQVGKSYSGTADFSFVEPSGNAIEVLRKEIIENARIISTNSGIPIHWLSYPDLMSNRATAENMLEMINSGTIQERTIWEEKLAELVVNCMEIAVERGYDGAVYNPDSFEIRLPLISYANLKQIQETWIPLAEMEYISKDTVRNFLPAINPSLEKKLIQEQKEENINNSPLTKMLNMDNKKVIESDDKEVKDE